MSYYLVLSTKSVLHRTDRFAVTNLLYLQGIREVFSQLPKKLQAQIGSLVLIAAACMGLEKCRYKELNLKQCWSIEAMACAMTDPTLGVQDIHKVYSYFARNAPKSLDLMAALELALPLLLKGNGNVSSPRYSDGEERQIDFFIQGMHLLEYFRIAPWMCKSLENLICKEGISGIFMPYEVELDASDDMQIGVKAAIGRQAKECKPPTYFATEVLASD